MRDADRRGRAAVRAPRAAHGERDGAGGGHDGAAQLHLPQDVSQVRKWVGTQAAKLTDFGVPFASEPFLPL